ncbi:MAG: DUF3267 domain-containing protein [Clostridium sp.]|nr:DUF3267 domain-containing protein [Clostridium sp.]
MTKIAEFRLTKYNSLLINLAALTSMTLVLVLLLVLEGKSATLAYIEKFYYSDQILPLVITLLVVVIMHEAIHGMIYLIFGAKLKFGISQLNIYTMDVSGNLYTISQMAIIMLLPFFALTGLLIATGILFSDLAFCMIIGIICNVSGSTGDILLLAYIFHKKKLCKGKIFRIKDEKHGFGLYVQ